MLGNIKSKHLENRILKELPTLREKDITVVQAPYAPYLVGKTLGEISKNLGLDFAQTILKIMEVSKMQSIVFYKNINIDLAIQSLANELALIASNGPSLLEGLVHLRHERISNTFLRFLEIISKTKLMSIPSAIQKITSKPAKVFNFTERGEVKEGNIADLTMIKDGAVSNVLVSGKVVVKDGIFENILAGKVLKSS